MGAQSRVKRHGACPPGGDATFAIIRSMASGTKARAERLKVREHRKRLRAQGLRPIQIWVPDVRAAAFRAQAHQQSLCVSASAQAHDDQACINALSDLGDE